jgi:hypothetical protein
MEKKASKVYVRLGFEDQLVTKEEAEFGEYDTPASYLVGYEDFEGRECDEDGNYIFNDSKE